VVSESQDKYKKLTVETPSSGLVSGNLYTWSWYWKWEPMSVVLGLRSESQRPKPLDPQIVLW